MMIHGMQIRRGLPEHKATSLYLSLFSILNMK